MVLAEALYLIRYPHISLAYTANKFKELTLPAYIEAIINIVFSISLVHFWGIVGVALGTVAGMMYRLSFQVYYTKKLIPDRKQIIFYRKFIVVIFITILGICINLLIYPFKLYTVTNWILHGFVYAFVFSLLYGILSITLFRRELKYLLNYIHKK